MLFCFNQIHGQKKKQKKQKKNKKKQKKTKNRGQNKGTNNLSPCLMANKTSLVNTNKISRKS